ncbi:MAG: GNAT family N-acetyltransferase [Sciscionella sp.]|nr:GNAT family N-acetyltransferase [Sciscionella sp.]
MADGISDERLRIVPANEASWDDLRAVFGDRDYAARCLCQRLKVAGWIWRDSTYEQRVELLREQTGCDDAGARSTSGLVAYVDSVISSDPQAIASDSVISSDPQAIARGEPAGWVAVEPRTAYPKLRTTRIPWSGRAEDKDDTGVWAVTCLIVRRGFRGRGLTYALAAAAVGYAREHGAKALEAYPMITEPGKEITWGELNVGARQVFDAAGFTEVSHPTKRRVVMRVDF